MEKKRIGFDLPEDVYIEVKVKCIRNHMTLTGHIIQLIHADLEKDKKKSTHWSGKIRNECNTQQPQRIAISILLKLYSKINGNILGIVKFGLQSWKYSFLWFRRIPYTAEPYRR